MAYKIYKTDTRISEKAYPTKDEFKFFVTVKRLFDAITKKFIKNNTGKIIVNETNKFVFQFNNGDIFELNIIAV